MKKLIINYDHVNDDIHVARAKEYKDRVAINLKSLDAKACAGKLPNTSWYRPVRNNKNEVLGYICGRGHVVTTNLTATMVAKGEQV